MTELCCLNQYCPHFSVFENWLQANCPHGQGRTQDRADGAKAPPPNPPKKLCTHLNPEHFMFRSLFILLQIMFPDSID